MTVDCLSYPEVKEGVMLREGFVSRIEMDTKLSEMRSEMEQAMEHNMAVMEHRMTRWTNRMRVQDRAEMIDRMQQQRVHDIAQMRDHALLHCKGVRKIASNLVNGIYCALCGDTEVPGYNCQTCLHPVCLRCFPMAFSERVHSADASIDYSCPYCIQTFASFPELSLDAEEQDQVTGGDEHEQVTGGDEKEQVTGGDE